MHLITEDGKQQYAFVTTASSYLSASDKRVYIGLGSSKVASRLEIRWPSGTVQQFANVRANQIFVVREEAK